MNLVKRGEVKVFVGGATIDLAVYEAANAVWKECHLLKKIGVETALRFIELLSRVFDALELYAMKGLERNMVDLALREGITVYDAAYIHAAKQNKLTLVTDDQKLREVASKYVNTVTGRQLASH